MAPQSPPPPSPYTWEVQCTVSPYFCLLLGVSREHPLTLPARGKPKGSALPLPERQPRLRSSFPCRAADPAESLTRLTAPVGRPAPPHPCVLRARSAPPRNKDPMGGNASAIRWGTGQERTKLGHTQPWKMPSNTTLGPRARPGSPRVRKGVRYRLHKPPIRVNRVTQTPPAANRTDPGHQDHFSALLQD